MMIILEQWLSFDTQEVTQGCQHSSLTLFSMLCSPGRFFYPGHKDNFRSHHVPCSIKTSQPREKGDELTGECSSGAKPHLQCVDCDQVTTMVTPWLLTPPLGDARIQLLQLMLSTASGSHSLGLNCL